MATNIFGCNAAFDFTQLTPILIIVLMFMPTGLFGEKQTDKV